MKNKIKRQKREIAKATIALYQILILVIATIAFSWMIGNQIETVSADVTGLTSDEGCTLLGGTCMLSTACAIENIRTGLCPGDATIRCCVPTTTTTTEEPEPEKDKTTFGEYLGLAVAIPQTYATGKELLTDTKSTIQRLIDKGISPEVSETTTNALAGTSDLTIKPLTSAEQLGIPSGPTQSGPATLGDYFSFGNPSLTSTNLAQIASNAFYTAIVVAAIIYFANKYASERNAGDLTTVSLVGAGVGMAAATIWAILATEAASGPPGWLAAAVTLVAAAIYMIVGYQQYSREVFTYRSAMWQPPTGGAECSKCNSLTIAGENACSKYICHSYGAACDWVNDETEYETCIEVNQGDISAPVLAPAKEIYGENVFPNNQYDYRTSSAGARIVYNGEGGESGLCVPAFVPIKLALTTNENAVCKIALEPNNGSSTEVFGMMKDMVEGNAYTKNHTLQLPSSVTANADALLGAGYTLNNGGTFKFYVRCKDVRGNINNVDYSVQFCVQTGPDTRPAEITGTNPPENSYIPYNTSMIQNFQVYTNEPADCKWDTKEVNYPYMSYNFTKCSQSLNEPLVGFDFGCEVNLTGFKNGIENKYYVACIDHPELKGTPKQSQRNVGRPYEIILKGTSRLVIQTVMINDRPNGTSIRGSEEYANIEMKVITTGGAENGNARCLYTENSKDATSYSLFSNDGSREYLTTNTEKLYMPQGIYKYFIRCFDIADNFADTMVNFSVEVDTSSPIVVRVYKDETSDSLKIITDEVGGCFYSTISCNYEIDEGVEIETGDGKEHYVEWNTERDLYVKCIDEYNNRPAEGECSIIVRPFELAQTIN